MFKKILIANRGEIACRVIKTAQQHGHRDRRRLLRGRPRRAATSSCADEAVLHRPGARRRRATCVVDKIIAACQADRRRGGASRLRLPVRERGASRRRSRKTGIVFIGPKHDAIAAMGDKIASKKLAEKAKVNTIPGYTDVIRDAGARRRDRARRSATR